MDERDPLFSWWSAMSRSLLVLVSLAACAGPEIADTADPFVNMEPGDCQRWLPSQRLVIGPGHAFHRVDYAWADSTHAEISEHFDGSGDCRSLGDDTIACAWMHNAITVVFDDRDGDEIGDDYGSSDWYLEGYYPGTSRDGLGLYLNVACWVERFGTWDEAVTYEGDERVFVRWYELDLELGLDELGNVDRIELSAMNRPREP